MSTFPATSTPIRQSLAGLWSHLQARRKRQLLLVAALMVASALAEAFSLAVIVPFVTALTDSAGIVQQALAARLLHWLGLTEHKQLLVFLALVFGCAALLSAGSRALQLWASTRLSYAIGGDFSVTCYYRTLHQPYETHLSRNSSAVLSAIAKKVGVAIAVLYQIITLISSLILSAAVIAALLVINWKITLVAGVSLSLLYVLVMRLTQRTLFENSLRNTKQEDKSIQALQEGLGGIRDVLLDGAQNIYRDKYAAIVYPLRNSEATNVFLAGSPRYLLEAAALTIVAALACYLTLAPNASGFSSALPVLGAFALGAQRLLPTLQQIYAAWAGVIGNHGAIADVLHMLDQPLPKPSLESSGACTPLSFHQTISLKNICYRYTQASPWVLDQLDLQIVKGSRVGIVGSTGSGKSTVLDLLMALLVPTQGMLLVDGKAIDDKNRRQWQCSVAHVPQQVYLTDASIAENIAFGVPKERIDMARVKAAARQTCIDEFIESRPEGYMALVGERGVRLSGGQVQRIGIARALYKQAPVLILDEATSALDHETEQLVMQTIDQLDRNLTVIIVAHRLSTLKNCDCIFELQNGQARRFHSVQELHPTPTSTWA